MHVFFHTPALALGVLLAALPATAPKPEQEPDPAQFAAKIDAAVRARVDGIASYTVTERYTVYRGDDRAHAAAGMIVHTTYQQGSGKSYQVVSESGSSVLRRMILRTVLDNEREVNRPGIREHAWFTTANYQMQIKPGGPQLLDGRSCYALAITPKPGSQHLVEGTLWADARTGAIVRVQGSVRKGLSLVTGNVQVFRKYADVDGFAQATYATAESNSPLFGHTLIVIDYSDYRIVLKNP